MTLIEEEAKTKWCPYSRTGGEPGCNRLSGTECIASQCMAWRWFDSVDKPLDAGPTWTRGVNEHRRGFCGLAGNISNG